ASRDVVCFFFSSRRRHTRLVSDCSSDVCSSDLPDPNPVALARAQALQREAPPGGVLGKLYTVLKPSPGVSTKTAAASNASQEERSEERRVGKECRCRWARDA